MKLKYVKFLSWIASIALVGSALFFSYIILFPVDVLSNWTLNIKSDKYELGQTVVLSSLYDKNVSAVGTANRYIECKNPDGVYVRYLLSGAVANRQAKDKTGTGITVVIPSKIAEVNLPTTCFFSIIVTYDVSPRRANPEYVRSKDFTLYVKLPTVTDTTTKTVVESQGSQTITTGTNDKTVLTEPAPSQSSPKITKKPTPTPPKTPEYKTVCDPLISLLGIQIGQTNCRKEQV